MAGLEGLISMIYHEKQQPGSMLCAQHALNSLLQGNYFTAPDLSDIARNLDTLEGSYRDEQETESRNMDDTGFFSVQVLENALKVWGLNLVHWRSEEIRPYNDHPHTQLAFILNLEQHWFTVRRFGPAVPNIELDPGEGHWFNLNSFLSTPEWVGKLYLGMVLQQAEAEGYSVFAVTQADPAQPLALPRTLADEVASTLPEPSSASASINSNAFTRTMDSSSTSRPEPTQEDHFEDEDYELQAALQASLMAEHSMDVDSDDDHPAIPVPRPLIPLPSSTRESPALSGPSTGMQTPQAPPLDPDLSEIDPVAASMARNKQLLDRIRQEQEFAQRDIWSEEDRTPEEVEALQQRREARRREEEREEEELRRAIEESERMAKQHQGKSSSSKDNDEDDDEDDEEIVEELPSASSNLAPAYYNHDRVYDDDDAELQAALKASLEHMPAGYEHPELEEPPKPSYPTTSRSVPPAASAPPITGKDREDNESIASTETSMTESAAPEPIEEPLSVDEIRRRRLARFGG